MLQLNDLLENFSCDLCGQRNEEFLYTKCGVISRYPFRVVRCRSCGLIYVNPRLSEQALLGLYDKDYYNGKGFDHNVNYVEDFHKKSDIDKVFRPEETIRIIQEIVPPPSTFLDFGCGLGDLLRQAIKHGYKAEGFEVSPFATEFVRGNGFRVYDSFDQLPHEQYDIVTAIEVLEHCCSPTKVLATIYKCLKHGGVFYYITANFDGFGGSKDYRDGYVLPEGHIHFFSTRVMKSYFKKIGYSQVFCFQSKAYQRSGRLFRFLSELGLIENQDTPTTFSGKFLYYGLLNLTSVLKLRKVSLPLARK